MMACLRAYLLGALLVGATAYPGLRPPGDDDYPLSTYPMFSRDRGRKAQVSAALALDAHDRRIPLAPSYIANSEAMQAVKTLNTAPSRGRRAARKLCRAIAERVAHSDDPSLADATHIQLQRQRVDSVAFLTHGEAEGASKVLARCPVSRDGTPAPGARGLR